jgi:membrane fusion protein (multidrug efflux system)
VFVPLSRCVSRPFALLLGAALCAASGCSESEPGGQGGPDSEPPVVVEIATIHPETLIDEVALTGQLEAEYSIQVKPEIEGVVEAILFEEGQHVAAGAMLVQLRDGEQRARLAESEAELRLAQDTFDRTTRLTSRDAASEARRQEAASGLDRAKARVQLARVELDRTRIEAAFDGVVGRRLVSPGDRVRDSTPLVELNAIERLQLLFTVEEAAVALARTGVPIHARVVAWPGERFPGEVYFVSTSLDRATRRLLLKAWIANPDHRLKPGMFANVDVQIERREHALLVPESALVYDRNGTYVWKVGGDGRVEKTPIEIGLRQAGRVQVVRGIAAGDRVVAAGTNKVMAGRRVRPPGSPPAHAQDGDAVGEDQDEDET